MADISDAELAELKRAHELLKSLYADGAVGMDFRKIVKKKYPNAVIPELDAVNKVDEVGGALEKRFGEFETNLTKKIDGFLDARKKEREDDDVAEFQTRVKNVVKERGYTKEGEEGLLKLMKDKGVSDPHDAAILFEAGQPKVKGKPRSFSTRMDFIRPDNKEDEAFKALMADPEQYAMDALTEAIDGDSAEE